MIYLIRHGLDDEAYIGGWSDVDLISEGIEQVEETIQRDVEAAKEVKEEFKDNISSLR